MKKMNFKKAYTMAEVVAAMIAIAIIIGVTLNITLSKLERVNKYTYYSAYTLLSDVVREIAADSATGLVPDGICENMQRRLNLATTKIKVDGSDIDPSCTYTHTINNSTDFSKLKPNIVTRNGMRFYNLAAPVVNIKQLSAASVTDANGYIIYVDIDSNRNNSKLYTDVFPFYVTRSGKVIPAYPKAGTAGGNGLKEMLFSVRYDEVTASDKRIEHWLVKSVSFKEAACKSGFVSALTDYCTNTTPEAYTIDSHCDDATEDCILVPVKPVRYFVK